MAKLVTDLISTGVFQLTTCNDSTSARQPRRSSTYGLTASPPPLTAPPRSQPAQCPWRFGRTRQDRWAWEDTAHRVSRSRGRGPCSSRSGTSTSAQLSKTVAAGDPGKEGLDQSKLAPEGAERASRLFLLVPAGGVGLWLRPEVAEERSCSWSHQRAVLRTGVTTMVVMSNCFRLARHWEISGAGGKA